MRATIYVTDDDRNVCSALSRRLVRKGHLVRSFHSGQELLEALDYEMPDLLFLDLKMPEMDGLETLRRVRQAIPNTLVVMLTAYGSLEDAEEALKLGAYDFLIKSVDFSTVEPALERSLDYLELRRQVERAVSEKQRQFSWKQVIALSPSMAKVTQKLKYLSEGDTPYVFFQGEVGTGTEFLAQVFHYNSHQHRGPFVIVNCTEQNGAQLAYQLFGYERGAFSGANQAMPGAFESSDGGTLFIDEIEHLPLGVQASLVQAIHARLFSRFGSQDLLPLNNRVVMASTVALDQAGRENLFHPELQSLLVKNQIDIPPLRERKEDIIALVMKNIYTYCEEIGRPKVDVDSSVPALLENYRFPGNIRELEAMVRRALLCADGPILTAVDFSPQHTGDIESDSKASIVRIQFALGQRSLQEVQGMIVHEVLRLVGQDKEQAAQYLQISTQSLDQQILSSEESTQVAKHS
ncbi:MAG: sigma-54-dependent transcriptional regulator [Nitrospirales bacterium]